MIFYPTCAEATHVDFENETIDLKVTFNYTMTVTGFKVVPFVRDAGLVKIKGFRVEFPPNVHFNDAYLNGTNKIEKIILGHIDKELRRLENKNG